MHCINCIYCISHLNICWIKNHVLNMLVLQDYGVSHEFFELNAPENIKNAVYLLSLRVILALIWNKPRIMFLVKRSNW